LIHAAAGGVGQAAIQMALRDGAEVFATVGSLEKSDFLESTYGLPRDHILSSRDLSFKSGIMRMTNGVGVDIVINSLSGDMLRASWECVAPFGRFAEIGLDDILSRARLSMEPFARGARYESLELGFLLRTNLRRMEKLWQDTIDSVFGRELKRATPITTYPFSRIQDALRHMQTGKHIGKLVVEPHDNDVVQVVEKPKSFAKIRPDATYVLAGGFGGIGIEFIRWMVRHGARNVIVLSRRGPVEKTAQELVAELEQQGVKIASPTCDLTDKKAVEHAISSCLTDMPPVRGGIQATAVLKVSLIIVLIQQNCSTNKCNHDLGQFIQRHDA
jgi:NADPH:quinone reductase-like Zn-dependent oxidoreductase